MHRSRSDGLISLEPVAAPAAPLARRNPVAKLAAALVFSFTLLATLDPVAPAIAIAVELAVLPLFGIRLRGCWPGGPGRCCSARPASW